MDNHQLLNLLQISDSLFPIGGFTLSNGLETLVQQERVTTPGELEGYLRDYLHILPWNELGAACLACRLGEDPEQLQALDGLMAAGRSPSELRMGSKRLCQRFIKVQERIQQTPCLTRYAQLLKQGQCFGNHSIAVGLFWRDLGIGPEQGLIPYCYSLLTTMVTNAVKLIPLSQLEGQRVLHALFPAMEGAAAQAQKVTLEEIGISGAGFDLCSMEHETLYSRIYIS